MSRTTAIFERCGIAPDDAGLVAETLVIADLRGVHSHGLLRVLGDMVHGPRAGHDGHFVLVPDIAAFESLDRFRARVDGVIRPSATAAARGASTASTLPATSRSRRRPATGARASL